MLRLCRRLMVYSKTLNILQDPLSIWAETENEISETEKNRGCENDKHVQLWRNEMLPGLLVHRKFSAKYI